MNKPTAAEIQAEVLKREEFAPRLPRNNHFVDSTRAAIKAEIRVLTERLTEPEGYDCFEDDEYLLDHAREAYYWAVGKSEDGSPSESWAPLVK